MGGDTKCETIKTNIKRTKNKTAVSINPEEMPL